MGTLFASLQAIVLRTADLSLQLVPYVVVGALAGAWLRGLRLHHSIERLGDAPMRLVVPIAAAAGTVSPLCTFGTVPVLWGLMGRGLPAPAALAFLVSSSMTNPQILALTAGTVGPALALACWIAAWTAGLLAGGIAHIAIARGHGRLVNALKSSEPDKKHHKTGKTFVKRFLDDLEFIGMYLVPGILVAAVLGVLVPERAVVRWLGPENMFAVVISAVVSVPLYVCGGGVLPVLGELMDKGVPGGVVLAFLIAGPATRIQALAAVKAVLTWRALIVYVLLVMGVAVLVGSVALKLM